MRMKAAFLAGSGIGYVLGTRAGREQFEKIRGAAQGVWESPRVQSTVSGVQGRISEKAPELKGKVTEAVQSIRSGKGEPVAGDTTDSLEAGGDLTADGYRPSGPTALS